MLNRNRGIGIGGWIALIWIVGSLAGIVYAAFILFGGFCLWIWVLLLTPHARNQEKWLAAKTKFDEWKNGRSRNLTAEEMQLAANYYMLSDVWDIRLEDLNRISFYLVEKELRPFIESERDLPRRWRREF